MQKHGVCHHGTACQPCRWCHDGIDVCTEAKNWVKKNEYQAKRQRTILPSRLRGQSKNKASFLVDVEKDAADVGPSWASGVLRTKKTWWYTSLSYEKNEQFIHTHHMEHSFLPDGHGSGSTRSSFGVPDTLVFQVCVLHLMICFWSCYSDDVSEILHNKDKWKQFVIFDKSLSYPRRLTLWQDEQNANCPLQQNPNSDVESGGALQ